jgi:hypothetical protein
MLQAMRRPSARILSVVAAVAVFAATAVVASAGEQPPPLPTTPLLQAVAGPANNPDLVTRCGLNVVLVLDESGSIRGSTGGPDSTKEVRAAAEAFLTGLSETGSRVAVVDFADRAGIAVPYLGVTEQTLNTTFKPYLTNNYKPNGWTNWDDAFVTAKRVSDGNPKADLVLFVTDGDPTARNNAHPNDQTAGGTVETDIAVGDPKALSPAVDHANELKVAGSHILMIGVGAALQNEPSRQRLRAVSGDDQFPNAALGSADYMLVTSFSALAQALKDVAAALCKSSVSVTKRVDNDSDGKFDNEASGWQLSGSVALSAGNYQWINPPPPTPAGERTITTPPTGVASFQWNPTNAAATATFTLNEETRAGYRLFDVTCTKNDQEILSQETLPAVIGGIGSQESVKCIVRNEVIPQVAVCHATGSADDPYDLDRATVLTDGSLSPNHRPHAGDIIPPYTFRGVQVFPGQNWTDGPAGGQAWLQNLCNEPVPPPVEERLEPTLSCVDEVADSLLLRAHFGYVSDNPGVVTLPAGFAVNMFSPGVRDRGQPSTFENGVHPDEVRVEFLPDSAITWTLNGKAVSADATSPRCAATIMVNKQLLSPNPDPPGRFDLLIDGEPPNTGAEGVGHLGTTGSVSVGAAPGGTPHTVGERAAAGTEQSNFDTEIICRTGHGDGDTIASGPGTSLSLTVHPDQHVVCTITNTDNRTSAPVEPILECVRSGVGGLSTAVWGYTNPNNYSVKVEPGNENYFTPDPRTRLDQPTTFAPGTNSTVFVTEFDAAAGAHSWLLQGSSATATADSEKCEDIEPPPDPPPPDPPPDPPFVPDPPTDISVTKTADPTTVTVGQTITWTMTVTNNSSVTATNVVGIRLQERFSFRSKVISIEPSQGTCTLVSCDLGTLAPGASATVVAVSEATQIGPVVNAVEVSTSQVDANPADNTASALVNVIASTERPSVTVRCGSLSVAPHRLIAARTAIVFAQARDRLGKRLAGVVVRARGVGISQQATTDARGVARFAFTPPRAGLVRFAGTGPLTSLHNPRRCASLVAVLPPQGQPSLTGRDGSR